MRFLVITTNEDEGPMDFFVNDVQVGSACYDEIGSQGIYEMRDMFRRIAATFGAEVEHEHA